MTNKEITKIIENTIKLVKQNNQVNNLIIITNLLDLKLELANSHREIKHLKHDLEVKESFLEKIQQENEELKNELDFYKIVEERGESGKIMV